MARASWFLIAASFSSACAYQTIPCIDDFDEDGVCGDEDVCPLDPINDEDGDGVCGSVDICPLGDDAADEDGDTIPDACDECLGDTLNDPDEDDICGLQDACPDVAGDCDREIVIGLQSDYYFEESTWRIVDDAGTVLDEGAFDSRGDGFVRSFTVSSSVSRVCVELADSYGDGGVRGFVWDENMNEIGAEWLSVDWTDTATYCATFNAGIPAEAELFDTSSYLNGLRTCRAQVKMINLAWGNENGWTLTDARNRTIHNVPTGSMASNTEIDTLVDVYDGQFILVMRDSLGDSWHGGSIEVRLREGDEPIVEGSLGGGPRQEALPFTVVCPER